MTPSVWGRQDFRIESIKMGDDSKVSHDRTLEKDVYYVSSSFNGGYERFHATKINRVHLSTRGDRVILFDTRPLPGEDVSTAEKMTRLFQR